MKILMPPRPIAETATNSNNAEESWDFFCECGDLSCVAVVKITIAEIQAAEPVGPRLAHA